MISTCLSALFNLQSREKWLKRTSFNVFIAAQKKKKKRPWKKTSEKIQAKPNFKRQFMPILLIDFECCHMYP